jgi:large subunit ribosomal protein L4
MRRAALRSALSVKAREGEIVVVEALQLERPRTKEMARILGNLSVEGKVLILMPAGNEIVELSARNLPQVQLLRPEYLNIRDLLVADYIVMPLDALEVVEGLLAKSAAAPASVEAGE